MNPTLAAFHLVRDYPNGAVALGPMMGKNSATLSHEVSPNYPSAKLGLEDAVRLTLITGDMRIANAFAAEVNCMLLPLPNQAAAPTSFTVLAKMAQEFAELVARVTDASTDGRTQNEARAVEREAGELIACVQATVQHVNALASATQRAGQAVSKAVERA